MKYLNKIAVGIFAATLGLMSMTSCEGGEMYDANSPSWLQDKIDSIAKNKSNTGGLEIPDGHEDVYTFGKTDFSSGWWAEFSKYYIIPDGQKWDAVINLNINPNDNTYYKNFALIITNNVARGGTGYTEYGAIRYDLTGDANTYNSNWGTYFGIIEGNDFKYTSSTLLFAPEDNKDANLQKMAGRVVITIDRTNPDRFLVKMNNGTITKTFDMPSALPNLNEDQSDTNIRAFLVPEGSYINFLQSNIEPVGGYTSAQDKNPIAMTLNGVPDEVLVGSSYEEVIANITASVNFEELPDAQMISTDQLLLSIEGGSLEEPGERTLVAIYNKTFKGENCEKPIYALAKFNVVKELSAFTEKYVCPNPVVLGAEDNSSGWWSAHTENIKVEPKQTAVVSFTNYTTGLNNWNNFVTVLCNSTGVTEYAVVRADNYGWGDGYAACEHYTTATEWAQWLAGMNGAHVTEYITNNGDGTADVKAVMSCPDGYEYTQVYKGINTVNKDDMYFNFTVDGCHLVFDTVFGAEDNSTGFWGAHTPMVQVPAHTVYNMSFTNYTCGANNWNNFCVVLTKADNSEYAVVRADNYGWGNSYAACTPNTTAGDWGAWLAAMNGAKVDLTVINSGTGSVDVKAVMHGTDGIDYTQTYTGISPVDNDDLYVRLTVDGSHVEFSPSVTQAKRNAVLIGKRPARKARR